MPVGFYELLQVTPDASPEAVSAAYQEQIAQVVRKQRAAEARNQDLSTIEARRLALAEAFGVLSDAPRRRRYDRFRELSRGTTPTDPEELWAQASSSLVDPAAAAALEVVRTLTDLKVGEALTQPPAEPEVRELRAEHRVDARAEARSEARSEARVELRVEPRAEPRADARVDARNEPRADSPRIELRVDPRSEPARAELRVEPRSDGPQLRLASQTAPPAADPARADSARTEPPRADPRFEPGRPEAGRGEIPRAEGWPMEQRPDTRDRREPRIPPSTGLKIHRAVPTESLARLADEYGPTGAYLRAARELRRITVEELSRTTHISQRFLEAMERDAFTELPAATFVRGYLKMVVRGLELFASGEDVDEFVDGYMSRYHRVRG